MIILFPPYWWLLLSWRKSSLWESGCHVWTLLTQKTHYQKMHMISTPLPHICHQNKKREISSTLSEWVEIFSAEDISTISTSVDQRRYTILCWSSIVITLYANNYICMAKEDCLEPFLLMPKSILLNICLIIMDYI